MLFNSYEFIFLFLPFSFFIYFYLLKKRLITRAKGTAWRKYSYKSLNEFGDINVDMPVTYKKNVSYLSKSIIISKHFLNVYDKMIKLVKAKHRKLFLTYPVTIKNPSFDLSREESRKRIHAFETLLKKHNIDIKCHAAIFNLDKTYFFNTQYHTNKYSASIRSEKLAECLNNNI